MILKSKAASSGGGGISQTSTQVNLLFVDYSKGTGAAARAGAQPVKAVLVKTGNMVTMTIQQFSLDNSGGQFTGGLLTDYDFIEAEFQIPAAYRPIVTFKTYIGDLISDAHTAGTLVVGAEGYVEIYKNIFDGFAGATVGTNGFAITATWVTSPAFV